MTAPADMTSAELLLAWQAEQQELRSPGLSWSAVGGCRRKAGYLLAQTPASNPSGSMQSALGSITHEKVAEVGTKLLPDDVFEMSVEFAGVTGHLDRWHDGRVDDTKTTSSRFLESVKNDGLPLSWRFQTVGYAAAATMAGYPVHTIRMNVIARDTGEEWVHDRPFDRAELAEALSWIAMVRDSDLDMLPRDYRPGTTFCDGCAFLDLCWEANRRTDRGEITALFIDDPDAAAWAAKLDDAKARKKLAEQDEADARGALDAIRPNVVGKSGACDVGYSKALSWTVAERESIDLDAVRAEYAAAGAAPPMKSSERVELRLVKLPKSKTGDDQ